MRTADTDRAVRTEYEEFTVGAETIAMIAETENPHAWLQSNVTVTVER